MILSKIFKKPFSSSRKKKEKEEKEEIEQKKEKKENEVDIHSKNLVIMNVSAWKSKISNFGGVKVAWQQEKKNDKENNYVDLQQQNILSASSTKKSGGGDAPLLQIHKKQQEKEEPDHILMQNITTTINSLKEFIYLGINLYTAPTIPKTTSPSFFGSDKQNLFYSGNIYVPSFIDKFPFWDERIDQMREFLFTLDRERVLFESLLARNFDEHANLQEKRKKEEEDKEKNIKNEKQTEKEKIKELLSHIQLFLVNNMLFINDLYKKIQFCS